MPIKRCSDQKSMTLEAFYIDLSKKSNVPRLIDAGVRMITLLQLINKLFLDTQLWGLTSHDRLVIQSKDDSGADWYIIISNVGPKEYYFEYLLPSHKSPWPHAMVRGEAKNLEEAKKYLLIAMRECEGWVGNKELERLLDKHL